MANYATTAEVKSFMRITDTDEDAHVANLVSSASRLVDSHCGFTFDDAAGSATARIFAATKFADLLKVDPISGTTSLVIKTDTGGDGTFDTTWASTDYQLEPLNQRQGGLSDHPYHTIRAVGTKSFPVSHEARVQVTALWGWTSGVPDAIRDATILITKYLHEERNTLSGFAFSEDGGQAYTSGSMSPRIRSMLAPYRRVHF